MDGLYDVCNGTGAKDTTLRKGYTTKVVKERSQGESYTVIIQSLQHYPYQYQECPWIPTSQGGH